MTNPSSFVLRLSDLPQTRPTRFSVTPASADLPAIAGDLGLDELRKLRLEGQIVAEGKRDWRLTAELGATVVQPCVVSLSPVVTRIDEPITRRFLAHMPDLSEEDEEIEMAEDDTIEQLGPEIDLRQVMIEALSLALPLYPRADDAQLGSATFTEPGKQALSDDDLKPFAGLAALRDKLVGEDPKEE